MADMLFLPCERKGPKNLADMLVLAVMLWRLCHMPLYVDYIFKQIVALLALEYKL